MAPILTDPWFLRDRLYLRASDGVAVRSPSPPTPLRSPIPPTVTLYRYPQPPPDGQDAGGGLVSLVLDLGAPSAGTETADVDVPPEVTDVVEPVHGPGAVRLWLGAREVASAAIPAGVRPVIPLAARLSATEVTLLRQSIEQDTAGLLWAAAEGVLPVRHDGAGSVTIDVPRARQRLADLPSGSMSLVDAAAAVAGLVEDGVIRLSVTDPAAALLATAVAAATLLEPIAAAEPWVAVPGVHRAGYAPAGAVRVRAELPDGIHTVSLDDAALPWCGAAVLHLPASAVHLCELPGSRVQPIRFRVNGQPPAEVATLAVQSRLGHGHPTTLDLAGDVMPSARHVLPARWDGEHSWRLVATTHDGHRLVGPWTTGTGTVVVLDPDDLAVLASGAAGPAPQR